MVLSESGLGIAGGCPSSLSFGVETCLDTGCIYAKDSGCLQHIGAWPSGTGGLSNSMTVRRFPTCLVKHASRMFSSLRKRALRDKIEHR